MDAKEKTFGSGGAGTGERGVGVFGRDRGRRRCEACGEVERAASGRCIVAA